MADPRRLPPSLPPSLLAVARQLLHETLGDQPTPLATPFEAWLTTSKPFLAFVQTYLDKIRKKVRTCQNLDETYNLYCEVRTAYLLLQEPKFALTYEPAASQAGRSADFAVTFRTHTTFHVEVTRLSVSQLEQQLYASLGTVDAATAAEPIDTLQRNESRRLWDVVCDKIEQLAPDTPNVLWVWSESRMVHALDLGQVMSDLKRSVEQRDAALYARYGYEKPADFLRFFQRLSAIVLQDLSTQATPRPFLWWQNKDVRQPLPAKVPHPLHAAILADGSPPFGGDPL